MVQYEDSRGRGLSNKIATTDKYNPKNKKNWELVDYKTKQQIQIGDIVETFKGEEVKITAMRPPHKSSSSGHVTIRKADTDHTDNRGFDQEVFATVIGAEYRYKG